ncbi:1-deoxy-D-xylulose-5-phosphate reductoisomerase [Methyloversatilis sp.]|uniref:1-deoxy-D-xylulose-5-phosphate reductoisomerase n=1 Tax=Methyloversatilis sp. TaxID=2569862 RepID=UPI002734EA9D|nr:1-deoxy-D-xylulose-5-phosphate reductoisomerase [Methyloversatilis sp.]MDP2868646.1 1-deoxy-D-xylulose-5-phosphate reductoisomerase [Methyloversatilis sp.]MDP3455609.1 1-deoxy-D-xylulose-5-phosphate reductoisomerase [Methyloversatilis sp.]MDP3577470.1 1-deoxy-D-xylulose-5-phosphate reductoisomerase [Methyloversatilis sp.]
MRRLTILGATGSIGVSTLDVVARHPDRFEVVALSGHRQIDKLAEQCLAFAPKLAVVADADAASALRGKLAGRVPTEVMHGSEALETIAALPEVDTVMAAIVGAAGLRPTLAAARSGKRILLANKESLVMCGAVFMHEVASNGATLLPIDSEHNAVFQCLPTQGRAGVRRILLTASGGPFRCTPLDQLDHVTPDQACAHPNWEMGRKISVDSATMMNKGLEVIEAHWLFDTAAERIDVVIHPQSIVHSMVEYVDGSVLAQMGNPDMRTPIAHALAWPERIESGVGALDLAMSANLVFERPDLDRFPCLRLAFAALAAGQGTPAVLNAANEVAVAAFLERRLGFRAIADVIAETLDTLPDMPATTLDDVFAADAAARQTAQRAIRART